MCNLLLSEIQTESKIPSLRAGYAKGDASWDLNGLYTNNETLKMLEGKKL